jgi:hypothetical protein
MMQIKMNVYFHTLDTLFGTVAIVWSYLIDVPKILQIILSSPEISAKNTLKQKFPMSKACSSPELIFLAENICKFFNGVDIQFPLDMLCLDICTSFQKNILNAVFNIE